MPILSASAVAAVADHLAGRLVASPDLAEVALQDAGLEVTPDALAFLREAARFMADGPPATPVATVADHLAGRLAADPALAEIGGPTAVDVGTRFYDLDLAVALQEAGQEVTPASLAFLRVATRFAADVVPA